jgi:hypothetical protein
MSASLRLEPTSLQIKSCLVCRRTHTLVECCCRQLAAVSCQRSSNIIDLRCSHQLCQYDARMTLSGKSAQHERDGCNRITKDYIRVHVC